MIKLIYFLLGIATGMGILFIATYLIIRSEERK